MGECISITYIELKSSASRRTVHVRLLMKDFCACDLGMINGIHTGDLSDVKIPKLVQPKGAIGKVGMNLWARKLMKRQMEETRPWAPNNWQNPVLTLLKLACMKSIC